MSVSTRPARRDRPPCSSWRCAGRRRCARLSVGRVSALLGMDSLEHMADLADFGRWNVAEYIPIKGTMQRCQRIRQVLGGALRQAAAGIRNDQLHALETALDQVTQKRRVAGLVLLGALGRCLKSSENPQNLRRWPPERNIANLAGPSPLHHDAVDRYGCSPSIRQFATPRFRRRSSC